MIAECGQRGRGIAVADRFAQCIVQRKNLDVIADAFREHGKLTVEHRRRRRQLALAFLDVEGRSALRVPMMAWAAACGFPSPAEDYVDRPLDFNELLIEHPAATFAIRIEGESMTGAGIFPGDIAVVDRAREPVDGNVILALLDGAFTVKRYRIKDGAVWLQAENPDFADMPLSDGQSFEVWGVIKRCIRML